MADPCFLKFPVLVLAICLGGLSQAQVIDLQDKRILILGDSITQNGTYLSFVS